jgi:ATP adenylyltransferase
MKVLWAPWRMALISAPKAKDCIFCDLPRAGDDRNNLVLLSTHSTVVMLNRYPYNSGHVMVAPRRHVASLEALTREQHADLADALRIAAAAVRREFRPEGMNLGMNVGRAAGAGIEDHLHWHVVPRWTGDTNFMPAVGSVKVMPEHLLATYDRLHRCFARPRGSSRRRRAR